MSDARKHLVHAVWRAPEHAVWRELRRLLGYVAWRPADTDEARTWLVEWAALDPELAERVADSLLHE